MTREQGPFSLRMFHRSWGILMIQQNISAPTTVLDFPTREAFEAELRGQRLRHRRHLLDHRQRRQGARDVPHGAASYRRNPTIVVGGHVAAIPGHREHDRRRPHRARRRHLLDAPLSWARTRARPSAIPKSSPASARAPWGSRCRRPRAAPPPPSFLRWAAPWAATSAPRRRSSAARASSSTSTTPARNCSTSCREMEAQARTCNRSS